MAILKITKYPNPILKQPASEVTDFNSDLHKLIDDMFETMYEADGIGLAAPQVNISKRVAVIDLIGDGSQKLELINPKIINRNGKSSGEEGCLSIPEYRETVQRASTIKVVAFDRHGDEYTLEAGDLLAVCLQHEIDHLDGILFVDRISRIKKHFFNSWYEKNGPFE
jgi:peptide deformylase